jgi:Domain of unknown function (DUF1707)
VTQPSPGIRISDADRERAAARLQQALAEGRITLDELEERLAVVYSARYAADLLPPFADLPGDDVVPVQQAAPVPPQSADRPLLLRAGMGTLKRSGPWTVPSRIRVQSVMGSVILDFCDTTVPPVVDIALELGAGSARLLLPDGASADVDGMLSGMGTVRSKVASAPVPGRPHFRVHGRSAMGSVTVRYRYRVAGHRF